MLSFERRFFRIPSGASIFCVQKEYGSFHCVRCLAFQSAVSLAKFLDDLNGVVLQVHGRDIIVMF